MTAPTCDQLLDQLARVFSELALERLLEEAEVERQAEIDESNESRNQTGEEK